jgi:hypothetical protein
LKTVLLILVPYGYHKIIPSHNPVAALQGGIRVNRCDQLSDKRGGIAMRQIGDGHDHSLAVGLGNAELDPGIDGDQIC